MQDVQKHRGLQTVLVDKAELLEKIERNRADHRAIFEEALEGWQRAVIKELEQMADDAKAGREYRLRVGLIQPTDHTDDYDAVIEMLKMSQDDELVLSRNDFEAYVLDRWGWQADFASTSMQYSELANTKYGGGQR